jgi:hypothetical protein
MVSRCNSSKLTAGHMTNMTNMLQAGVCVCQMGFAQPSQPDVDYVVLASQQRFKINYIYVKLGDIQTDPAVVFKASTSNSRLSL